MSPRLSFSSDQLPGGLPEDARFAAWADIHAQNNGAFEWTRHEDAPFDALFESRSLGKATVGRMSGSLSTAMRTRRQILADNDDQFVLAAPTSPRAISVGQRGREISNASGAVFLMSMAEPIEVRTAHTSNRWLNIMLPAEALRARAPMADDMLALHLPDPEGALKLLAGYSALVLDGDVLDDPRLAALAADHCLDLAVLALGARGDAAEAARLGGLRAVRLKAILRRISQDFADPTLSAETVAAKLGLSTRYVHVLLQESGVAFSERVLEHRLDAAMQLLARDRPIRVSDAAFRVGFSDLSYFNRCFRRRYGVTPTGARGRRSS